MHKKAMKKNVYNPEDLLPDACKNITGDPLENKKEADYPMQPIIGEGSNLNITGEPGTAKTWMAMAITTAIDYQTQIKQKRS